MLHERQRLKKIILILILVNVIAAGILMVRAGYVGSVIGAGSAVAAEDTDSTEDTTDKADGEDAESGKKADAELTEEELAAKQAEEAKLELDGLEAKRMQLKEQEERILKEQEKLKTLKKELEEKIAGLESIHRQINVSLEKLDRKKTEKELRKQAEEDRKIKQLVKVYSSMKPKNAGQIINTMDIVVAEKIIRNMKGDAAGKILSYVDSGRAAAISERLATGIGTNNP